MAKDPAFLFYSSDFLIGVQFMSLEERGVYITLLCAQHQHGKIDPKRVGFILGFDWDMVSVNVKEKFKVDENGFIFNERLSLEAEKRAAHLAKQRDNGKKGGRPKKPNETQPITQLKPKGKAKQKPLENENEIENKDINKDKKGGVGEKKEIPDLNEFLDYCLEQIPDSFEQKKEAIVLKYKSWLEMGWKTGGEKPKKIINWKATILNTLPYLTESNSKPLKSTLKIVTNR